MKPIDRVRSIAVACLVLLPSVSAAQSADPTERHRVDIGAIKPGVPGRLGRPVTRDVLILVRGGSEVENEADIQGRVTDNSAIGVKGAPNAVNGGAFVGAAGINTVIQNSGSNVLIQNALVVNVEFGGVGP
jgi:hypothetical protein